jgi:membrane-bound serine protease (ClpP class)
VTIRRPLTVVCLVVALTGLVLGPSRSAGAGAATGTARPVVVVHFKTTIDELGKRYLEGALKKAADENAEVVIIQLDTPGGALFSAKSMVSAIIASKVPVVVWVGPSGAWAASAGTFIASAASYLAMAPATGIGAASVVGSQGENVGSTEARKTNQADAALIASIAHKRHRSEQAVKALRAAMLTARAYSAEEAVKIGIADAEISSLSGVIAKLDGMKLATASGRVVVQTAGHPVQTINMGFWQRLLDSLSDPNLVYLLLNLGGLGLIIELWMAGRSWVPGALGIICLLAAFAGLSVLPFSWAGLALILVGIALLGVELHAPGHLVFGISGTVSIILGGVFLLGYFGGPGLPGYNPTVSLWVLITFAAIVGTLVFLMAREVHLSHHGRRYVSPVEKKALVGQIGEVNTRLAPTGEVWAGGEAWQAKLESGGTAEPGERVSVVAIDGFHLIVRPLEKEKNAKPKTKKN